MGGAVRGATAANVLIVGEAPGPRGDPSRPLESERLAGACGLSLDEFCEAFARVNLLDAWPGYDGQGSRLPEERAADAAAVMLDEGFDGRDAVVLLGRRVARAFGVGGARWLEPLEVAGTTAYVVPHPSGLNRWHNDRENRKRYAAFWRALVAE